MQARWFIIDSYKKTDIQSEKTPHDGVHYKFDYKIDLDIQQTDHLLVSVVRTTIPKTWPLVKSGSNTFTMTEPGQPAATITIPPGSYNALTFAADLGTILTAASTSGVTYTCVFSRLTGRQTITSVPATATQLTFAAAKAESVADQLGCLASYSYTFTAGVLTSPNVCGYVPDDAVCIQSSICRTPGQILQDVNAATVPFGASITWQSSDIIGNAKPFSGKASSYNFSLQDVHGHALDTQGRPWSLTLVIFRDPAQVNLSALKILGPKLDKALQKYLSEPAKQ